MLNKDIKNATLYLAIITASLYVFGLFFHYGVLEFWGLSSGLFPLRFEEYGGF